MSTKIHGRITLLLDKDGARIEVTDNLSGIRICQVEMDTSATMAALGRQAMVDGTVTLYAPIQAPIGYKVETKTAILDFTAAHTKPYADRQGPATPDERAVLAPVLVDGWTVSRATDANADYRNHHCRVTATGKGDRDKILYRVSFTRWVDPFTGAPWIWPPDPALGTPQPASSTVTDPAYVAAAKRVWQDDGQIEIDPGAAVSKGTDKGAYVAAWVWVHASEADHETALATKGDT